MIVIACYNDINLVQSNVTSLLKTNNLTENILLVATDPSQTKLINHLKSLEENHDLIKVLICDSVSFDSGAYINAYMNFSDDYYIFFQDSVIVNDDDWLDYFKQKRNPNEINAWITFEMPRWDYEDQKNWILSKLPNNLIQPSVGVFGPNFQISREGLDRINGKFDLLNFIPTTKSNAMGMERGWSYLAVNSDLSVNNIEGDYLDLINKKTKLLKKLFYNRQ